MLENKPKQDQKKYVFLLMFGHLVTDINQGALPAALPFLVLEHDLSFKAAGGLMLALTGVSSIIQPFLGHLSDRTSNPQIMSIGIIVAGGGLSALGIVNSYSAMFICVTISGIGIALFHPEGGRMVNCVAKKSKGEAMSIFSLGGNIGFAVGPLIVASVVPIFGIRGLIALIIPPIAMLLYLQYYMKDLKELSYQEYSARKTANEEIKQDNWKGFSILATIILLDSIVDYGLITFLPLFWVSILGQSEAISSSTLAVVTALGAISTYIGGKMADIYGFRKIIIWGSFTYVPAILFVGLSTNMILATIAILLLGLVKDIIQSPAVALGQNFLPNHVGLASGITLGLAVSVGGIASPVLGWVGDRHGLVMVMLSLAALGAFVAFFSVFIPKKNNNIAGEDNYD